MKILKLLVLVALTTGFFMTMSCKKGDTGPAGPAGPDSVKYSSWITLSMSYAGKNSNGDSVFTQSITASAITSSVLGKGSVIGYLLVSDPLTSGGDSSIINASLALNEYFAVGKIDLVSIGTDWSGYDYRYVIVPAKIAVTGSGGVMQTYSSDQISKMNYTTLSGLLNIPATGSGSKQLSTN